MDDADQWRAGMQSLNAAAEHIMASLREALAPLAAYFHEVVPKVAAVIEPIMGWFRQQYAAAGSPYGEGDEAMLAFYCDLRLAAQARDRAHQENLRVWMVADFRRQLRGETVALPVPELPPLRPFLPERLRDAVAYFG